MVGLRSAVALCVIQGALTAFASLAPVKLSLSSRKLAPQGRAIRRRSLSTGVNVPLDDFFNGTDLQWFGQITAGTPPQSHTVVFDTGSFDLEIASTLCGVFCSNQKQFDASKSSTFVNLSRTSRLSFGTGVGVDPVINNDYTLTVLEGMDTVSVGGITAPNTTFFLITNQTAPFNVDPFDGILGLGLQPQGWWASAIAQGLPPLFGMFLTHKTVGHAELTLGGIDETKIKGPLFTASSPAGTFDSEAWILNTSGIKVNNKTSSLLKTPISMIFDSGTTNVYFPSNYALDIYSKISPEIKPNPNEPNSFGIPCSKIDQLPAEITFTFLDVQGKTFPLTIPSSELNVGPFHNNPELCQTLINTWNQAGTGIIGGSLLKHYYSVWSVGNQTLGFAANGL